MTNGDTMLSKDCEDSPSVEEFSCGGNLGGGGGPLKKGPWTAAEDAILVDYVNKHGEGNWNAVQKYSGLSRCGKSCRLRWANHLRPDLKKGAFTEEEEWRIIELHAKMGNKWARMAAELPGRTDNEIKNYWNTRIKRRQRAGLPIYPPDVCQAFQESQHCQSTGAFPTGETHHPDLFLTDSLEIPAVDFKNLELNQQLYSPTLLEIPASNLIDIPARSSAITRGLGSSYSLVFSMLHPSKRLRESECLLPGVNSSTTNGFPAFDEFQEDGREKIAAQSFGFSAVYGHDLNANQPSSSSIDPGSHAFLNGNSSSSEPMSWVVKSELPSLQYSDAQVGSWGTSPSPLPSLESVDPVIQSPPTESDSLSRRNSGLLEAVLYESQTLKSSKNNSSHQNSSVSMVANDAVYSLSQNLCETECDVYSDPISPVGHSVTSVFNENTISGTSFGEPPAVEMLPMPGCKVKQEAVDWVTTKCNVKEENEDQEKICSRPDFLLASNWFGDNTERGREHSVLTDAIGALLGEDFSSDCKQSSTLCASSGQKSGRDSCAWDSLSTAQ